LLTINLKLTKLLKTYCCGKRKRGFSKMPFKVLFETFFFFLWSLFPCISFQRRKIVKNCVCVCVATKLCLCCLSKANNFSRAGPTIHPALLIRFKSFKLTDNKTFLQLLLKISHFNLTKDSFFLFKHFLFKVS
jgi:hypothetical protein